MTPAAPLPPFVDLHNHLVPGVDDGAANVAESLDALRVLYAEGVRTLVATPHLLLPHLATDGAIGRSLDTQRRAFDRLAEAVARERDLPAIGLGRSRTLLVEFGFDLRGSHTDVVLAVLASGRGIVIAHPERYHYPAGLR